MQHKIKDGKVIFGNEKIEKQKVLQAKLRDLADKKTKGKLTVDDVDAKLDIVIEILTDRQ